MAVAVSTLDRARKALRSSPIPALNSLEVQQLDGAIVISGRVESFYEKQLAQEAIRAVCGRIDLCNTVEVD